MHKVLAQRVEKNYCSINTNPNTPPVQSSFRTGKLGEQFREQKCKNGAYNQEGDEVRDWGSL